MLFRTLLSMLLVPAACQAQEMLALPSGGPPSVEAGLTYGGAAGAFYRESRVAAAVPLGRFGPWALRASLNAAHLSSFEDGYFPGELYRVGANVSARNGRLGWALGARSNSDRPFGAPDTEDLSADLTYVLSNGTHRLMAGLNYSSQRSFWRGIPFPYILYSYMSDDTQFALPFFLRTRLARNWWLTLAYIPVKNGRAALRYETAPGNFTEFEIYSRLEQYLPYDRPDKDQRLYRYSSAAALKRGLPLGRGFTVEAQAGYAFFNYYFTGEKFDDINARTKLGPWPFAGLAVKLVPAGKPAARR
ncbi:MAG: hypothetical protein NTY45_11180 [Elusimicrobia bacterium]|nr:hypothetical protein [Elusimicrobiota bacterium]